MRISSDLIKKSTVFNNALGNKEIDLRGNKIQMLENLGVTEDAYDTIDFSDNEIVAFENFPNLRNVRTLFFNNNYISRIKKGYGNCLPNLEILIFTSNSISELGEICSLAEFKKLYMLSFLHNPVIKKQHYRLFVIHVCQNLQILDFSKVKHKERLQAKRLFSGKEGEKLFEELSAKKNEEVTHVEKKESKKEKELKKRISAAINSAKSMEDVQRLTKIL